MTRDKNWETIGHCPTIIGPASRRAGLVELVKITCQLFPPPFEGMSRMQTTTKPQERSRAAVPRLALVSILFAVLTLAGLAASQDTKPQAPIVQPRNRCRP